jgi:hypothetical protein
MEEVQIKYKIKKACEDEEKEEDQTDGPLESAIKTQMSAMALDRRNRALCQYRFARMDEGWNGKRTTATASLDNAVWRCKRPHEYVESPSRSMGCTKKINKFVSVLAVLRPDPSKRDNSLTPCFTHRTH